MRRGDEMAQAAGAASPEDALPGPPRLIAAGPGTASPPLRIEQFAPARSDGLERLAQLARLIEQDQTLAAIVRRGKSEQRIDLSPSREKLPSSDPARDDKAFDNGWDDEAALALLLHRGSRGGPTGAPPDPPDYGQYDNPDYANGLPDQRLGLRVFAALIGLALAGSASAFAYWTMSDRRGRSDESRVMAASVSPGKSAPSPREQSRLDERPRDRSDERSINATDPPATGAEEPADAKPLPPQALPPLDIVLGPSPTKVAGLIPAPTPLGGPAGAAPSKPPELKKPARRHRARVAAAPSGADGVRYDVQLSSERSEAAARLRSLVLQTAYASVFAGRKPFIRRADLGDRGVYYRVQMGPFAIEEANEICANLKKAGGDCLVQRN